MLMINNYFAMQSAENGISNANNETKQATTGLEFQAIFANTLIGEQSLDQDIDQNNLLGKQIVEEANTEQMPFGLVNINLQMGTNINQNGEIETDIDADNILLGIQENVFSENPKNINTTTVNENTSLPADQITETVSTETVSTGTTIPENNPNPIVTNANANNNISTELLTANPDMVNAITDATANPALTAANPDLASTATATETSILNQLQQITDIGEKTDVSRVNKINTASDAALVPDTSTEVNAKSNGDSIQKIMDNIAQLDKKQESIITNANVNANANANTAVATESDALNIANKQGTLSLDKSDTLTLANTEPKITSTSTKNHANQTPSSTIEQNAISAQLANGVTIAGSNNNNAITNDSNMATTTNSLTSSEQSALNLGNQKQSAGNNNGENNEQYGQNQATNSSDANTSAQGTEKNITSQNNQIFQKYMAQASTSKSIETRSYSNVTLERFPELTARISRTLSPNGEQNIKMSMSPEGLGTVFVNLEMKDGVLSMTMKSDNDDTLKKIEHQLGHLKESIAKQGLKLENIELGKQSLTDSGQQSSGGNSSQNAQERRPNRDTIAGNNGNITTGGKDDNPNLQEEALPVYKSENIIEEYI